MSSGFVLVILFPHLVACFTNSYPAFTNGESTITPGFDCVLLWKWTASEMLVWKTIASLDTTTDVTGLGVLGLSALLGWTRRDSDLALGSVGLVAHTITACRWTKWTLFNQALGVLILSNRPSICLMSPLSVTSETLATLHISFWVRREPPSVAAL